MGSYLVDERIIIIEWINKCLSYACWRCCSPHIPPWMCMFSHHWQQCNTGKARSVFIDCEIFPVFEKDATETVRLRTLSPCSLMFKVLLPGSARNHSLSQQLVKVCACNQETHTRWETNVEYSWKWIKILISQSFCCCFFVALPSLYSWTYSQGDLPSPSSQQTGWLCLFPLLALRLPCYLFGWLAVCTEPKRVILVVGVGGALGDTISRFFRFWISGHCENWNLPPDGVIALSYSMLHHQVVC